MFPADAIRPSECAGSFSLAGPERGRPRVMRSSCWAGEVKRIRGTKRPLSSAGLHGLRDEYTRSAAKEES
jgi:hypothetical protein